MRISPPKHNLARLRLFLNLRQKQMAALASCSTRAIQSVELEKLSLSESLARRISAATDVHLHWLLDNDLEAPITNTCGYSYTRSDFEQRQATKHLADNELSRQLAADYAVSFYGQIMAILSNAVKKDLGEVATWKIAKFLDQCRSEFGNDDRLVSADDQFVLRPDYSVALKHRKIRAGIRIFRKYDSEREASIRRTRKLLNKRKGAFVTHMGGVKIVLQWDKASAKKTIAESTKASALVAAPRSFGQRDRTNGNKSATLN